MSDGLARGRCGNGESVFDVLEEMKADGRVPQSAAIGNRFSYGEQKNDPSIIGFITVRPREEFAIVDPKRK